MSISLFPHNQTAYESLLAVLGADRRACIIHPTGTGKSFIGFKYCEDHPEQSVLWLSPSVYIFKTQQESLLATDAKMPGNITFMTYVKLSQLDQDVPCIPMRSSLMKCTAQLLRHGRDRYRPCSHERRSLLSLG